MNQELKQYCFLLHSIGFTYRQISSQLNFSQSTICRAVTTTKESRNYQWGRHTASELAVEYAKMIDYFYVQQKKLDEEIKSTIEDVRKKNEEVEVVDERAKAFKAKYAVKLIDAKLKIMEQQSDILDKFAKLLMVEGKLHIALQTLRNINKQTTCN